VVTHRRRFGQDTTDRDCGPVLADGRPDGTDRRVDAFLDYARSELGSQVVIAMTPQHWLSADLGEA